MAKPTPITRERIASTIKSVCDKTSLTKSFPKWTFSLAQPEHLTLELSSLEVDEDNSKPTWVDETRLHGIVATKTFAPDGGKRASYLVTFFLAYSTWDGRVLFRDYQSHLQGGELDSFSLQFAWYYLLANVAIELECSRLVWSHYGGDGFVSPKNTSIQPERLPTWLTLHWSPRAMKDFAGGPPAHQADSHDGYIVRNMFSAALQQHHNQSTAELTSTKFSMRLATVDDTHHILRLVHGLAAYEKEPDSVNIGIGHYAVDGSDTGGLVPLYHCVLIDSTDDGSAGVLHTCGMAYCYIGHNLTTGRFLYLEDLYFEEPFRGKGAGTMVMKALALVAQSLGCTSMKWQALDWNTPALGFYEKIGAKVQSGLCTSRLVGAALNKFVQSETV